MQYFDVVLTLAVVFLGCAFFTLRLRLHSALAPLAYFSAVALVLTVGGVFALLRPAALLLYALSLLGGVAALAPIGKNRPEYRKLFSPGALLFWGLLLFFAVYFAIRKPMCTDYDELSLWGTAAKLTATDDALFTTAQVGWPWQASQNPGMIVLGYFFQLFGVYADWKIYLAYNALAFACFAAVLGGMERRSWRVLTAMAAILWCVPWFFTTYNHTVYLSTVYLTTYADISAGLVMGAAVAFWLHLRRSGAPLWMVLPVLALAGNIKSNTFVLSLVSAGLVAADYVLFPGEGKKLTEKIGRRIGFGAACMACPMGLYLFWNSYIGRLAAKNAASGGMGQTTEESIFAVAINGVKMALGLPVGEFYESRRAQYETACDDMLHQYLTADGKLSMIGQGLIVTLFILLVFALAWLLCGQKQLRLRIGLQGLLSLAGFGAYQFMLALSYGFIFKPFQAENLVDYNRYVYTYYIGWFLIALALLGLSLAPEKGSAVARGADAAAKPRLPLLGEGAALALACLMLLRLNQLVLPQLSVLGFSDSEFADRRTQQARAAAVEEHLQQDDRIFYVYQGDNGLNWFTACYDFYPYIVDYSGFGGGTFGPADCNPNNESVTSYYYHDCTADEFKQLVEDSGCDVLYIDHLDEIFIDSYAELFTDGLADAKAGNTLLYRVTKQGYTPVEMEVP